MSFILSKQERYQLERELRLERNAKYSDRIKCILLLDSGKRIEDIAEFLFLTDKSVRNYLKRYEDNKIDGLIDDEYHGSECRLNEKAISQLIIYVSENLCNDTGVVVEYVKEQFGKEYSCSGIRKLGSSLI